MITAGGCGRSLMRRLCERPSERATSWSTTRTSARVLSSCLASAGADDAAPRMTMSDSCSMTRCRPRSTAGWSSRRASRIMLGVCGWPAPLAMGWRPHVRSVSAPMGPGAWSGDVERDREPDLGAPLRRGLDREAGADQHCSFAHAADPVGGLVRRRGEAAAVVAYGQYGLVRGAF